MTPVVRPVFAMYEEEGKVFVSAEIPPVDITERPCFKTAKGRMQGSYIRVSDANMLMTGYAVYRYEAFRKKHRDGIRPVEQVRVQGLDQDRLLSMSCNANRTGRILQRWNSHSCMIWSASPKTALSP